MLYVEPSNGITDKIVFLKIFLPKNFGRISPMVYIFWLSLFSLLIGLMFYRFLWFVSVVGGFIFLIFVLFFYFWRNPLLDGLLKF